VTQFIRPELSPTAAELLRLKAVAGGSEPANLALRGGNVAFVHSGEFQVADVLIAGRHIAAVTPPGRLPLAVEEVDAHGFHLVPGFADCHIHIDFCLLPPGELARLLVPKGTTILFAALECLSYVFGKRAVDLYGSTRTPLRLFLQIPFAMPCYPQVEQGGEELSTDDILELLTDPRVASYGESNPYLVNDHYLRCLSASLANGRRVNGHTARLDGEPLWRYLAGGIGDDHNAATYPEAIERIRRGANLAVQSSSMSNYLAGIFQDPDGLGFAAAHIMFCADDKYVDDLADEGHIDHHLRSAVALGVPPIVAIRMATLNAAAHFRVDHQVGSITPTRLADIVMLPDLKSFVPTSVWVGGRKVAENGRALFDNTDLPYPEWVTEAMRIGKVLSPADFSVMAPSAGEYVVRVIEMYDGYYKRATTDRLIAGKDLVLRPDPSRDIAKMAIVDRLKGSGLVGRAFLRGFGLRSGAIAVSTSANQNIAVVGVSDAECAAAVNRLAEIGGGFVVFDAGKPVAELPLRFGGTVSMDRFETLIERLHETERAAARIGCQVECPFMILSFVGLPTVPQWGLTEKGLVDVESQSFLPVIVS
jgi:adenine deaminase